MKKKKQRKAVDPNDPVEIRHGKPCVLWIECGQCGLRSSPKLHDRFPDGVVAWGVCDACQVTVTSCLGTASFMAVTQAFLEGWASAEGGSVSAVRHFAKGAFSGAVH